MSYYFDRLIQEIFSSIIKQYDFYVVSVNEQEVSLVNKEKKVTLNFVFSLDGVDTCYIKQAHDNHLMIYNLQAYIASQITDQDRYGIDLNFNSFYEKNIVILKILAKALPNHFASMLDGDQEWFKDYKKSPYYMEPRIIEK